jgi:hypothetical protein
VKSQRIDWNDDAVADQAGATDILRELDDAIDAEVAKRGCVDPRTGLLDSLRSFIDRNT